MRPVAALALVFVAVLLPVGPASGAPSASPAVSSSPSSATSPANTLPVARDHTLELRDAFVEAIPTGPVASSTPGEARPTSHRGRVAARPSDPADGSGDFFWDPAAPRARSCGVTVCVHYVTSTADAPPLTASDGLTPDWVHRTRELTEHSLARLAELGYPAPPSDAGRGASAQFDVYLADVSRAGLYGYCAPEASVPGAPGHASSYCVFDDDFIGFPKSPDLSLRVTAAHELFHAVQFGMDVREDRWFLESTATWMEEQIADDVNDNRQYLSAGQLGRRHVPLDHSAADLGIYGNWIFFQFLAQRYGVDSVRQVWELADAGPGRRNDFSVKAVRRFVQSRRDRFDSLYTAFALANLSPRRRYDEGGAYRAPRFDSVVGLGQGRRTWRRQQVGVPHLTSRALAFRPRPGLRGRIRLRVSVASRRPSGAAASVQVFLRSGKVATLPVRLHDRGGGRRVVSFRRSRVRRVVVVPVNASTRYDCDRRTPYACQGVPRDDRQRFDVSVTVVGLRR